MGYTKQEARWANSGHPGWSNNPPGNCSSTPIIAYFLGWATDHRAQLSRAPVCYD